MKADTKDSTWHLPCYIPNSQFDFNVNSFVLG